MRGCVGLIVCTSLGCNWLYGLQPTTLEPPSDAARADADPRSDLDHDGIKDIVDPCIAPAVDALLDDDQDGIANGLDSCPFDAGDTGDSDGDGIADACDPFASAGDRVRCIMVFSDPDMDVVMWKLREQLPLSWELFYPRVLAGYHGSIVADWPFEAPATTHYDMRGSITANATGSVQMLARAAPMPAAGDAGCELVTGGGNGWALSLAPGRAVQLSVQAPTTAGFFRLRMTIEPGNADGIPNVRCTLRIGTGVIYTLAAHVPLGSGYLGFATTSGIGVFGIAIYERDDAPNL